MLRTTAMFLFAFSVIATSCPSQAESTAERLAAVQDGGNSATSSGENNLLGNTPQSRIDEQPWEVLPTKVLPTQIHGQVKPPTPPGVLTNKMATTSDRIKLTLRTEKETYHTTPLQLLNIRRYLQSMERLYNWDMSRTEVSFKLRGRNRDGEIATGKLLVGPFLFPTHEEIVAEIGERPATMERPSILNLGYKLDVVNTSKKTVDINLNLLSDMEYYSIDIQGSGAHKVFNPFLIKTMDIRPSHKVTIGPGETKTLSLSMFDGCRQYGGPYVFTEQGDFSTTITLQTVIDGMPTRLKSNTVDFKVVAH